MEPKPKRRASIGARRSPETEAAVKAAARDLLAEKGYAGFSIEEVARRAGAGKPTIYRWWPNKAELFIAIYGVEKDAAIPLPDTGSLRGDLLRYTKDLWRFWREDAAGRVFRGLIAEAQSSETALAALRFAHQPGKAVLQHAGANARQHVIPGVLLEQDVVDALEVQQLGQHEAGGAAADDRDLGAHGLSPGKGGTGDRHCRSPTPESL